MRVLGIREKVGNNRIRNSKSCTYNTIHNSQITYLAWNTTKKFKLDFVGIDIGERLGKYMIIELNSAPTIGPVWANKLGNDLIKMYKRL